MPVGTRLRTVRLHTQASSAGAPQPGLRGAQTGLSRPCPPGPRTGGRGPRRRPAPREGLARWAPAIHLRVLLGPGRRGREKERLSRSPRSDSVRRRPQPLVPGACFQIPKSSRGRVSFRRPEIRAPPPPRRAHVTATRSRAQPGRREREPLAPPPGGGGPRRKPPALRDAGNGERGTGD